MPPPAYNKTSPAASGGGGLAAKSATNSAANSGNGGGRARSDSSSYEMSDMSDKVKLSKAMRDFEVEHLEQAQFWSSVRWAFAAKHDLLGVLVQFEHTHLKKLDNAQRCQFYLSNVDKSGANALHIAVLCGSVQVTEYLITTYGSPLVRSVFHHDNCSAFEGESALHIAIVKRKFELVKLLIQYGADVNAAASGRFFDVNSREDGGLYLGSTPLHFAVCLGELRVVK